MTTPKPKTRPTADDAQRSPTANGHPRQPSQPAKTGSTQDWPNLVEEVLRRLQETVQQSLNEAPPIVTAIDASHAMLFKTLFRLDQAIDEALAHTVQPIERIDGLARAIDIMLRLTRQMDRFQRLRMLLEQTHLALADSKANQISQVREDSAT